MATRNERERLQRTNEKHKNILAIILAREENKFCADCLSKGPRWASWNLGVLLCIRCSGLHRAMGVHISRVKSVNLDTWTKEQMLNFCCRGNAWAKDTYEAKLPKDFRRPQTDSSLEYFIRDKYEKKKYISPVEISLKPLTGLGLLEDESPKRGRKKEARNKENVSIKSIPKPKGLRASSPGIPRPKSLPQLPKHNDDSPIQNRAQNHAAGPTTDDLLGLTSPVSKDAPVSITVNAAPSASSDLTEDLFGPLSSFQPLTMTSSVSSPDLLNGGETSTSPQEPATSSLEKIEEKKMSKDSILSLYSQGTKTSPLASGNFNIAPQTSMAYQQPQMQYNQQSYANMPNVNMQGMSAAYQQQQQQMMAMQQQQIQMQQMAQQMSNMNMTGMGYSGMPPQQNSMQNNMGYGMGFGTQPQASQPMYNLQQQPMYGGVPNGNPAMMPMSGYGGIQGGMMQNQPSTNGAMWGNAQPNSMVSGHTLTSQLWK